MKEIEDLRSLRDGWDDEGAPKPTTHAIDSAAEAVRWAIGHGLEVENVSADVIGGVAVYLRGSSPGRRAWLSFLNNGFAGVLLSTDVAVVKSVAMTDEARSEALTYLNH